MVPRSWVWAVIGLVLSLAPACAPARRQIVVDDGGPRRPPPGSSAESPPPKPVGQSPYHQQLPPVAPPPEPAKPSQGTREVPGLRPASFRNVEPNREVITAASRPAPAPVMD